MMSEDTYPKRLCVGVGTYQTAKDGEIYLCALLDMETGRPVAYSIGGHRSPELVEKALENLFAEYGEPKSPIVLRSSRNPLYRTRAYQKILEKYPVNAEMTQPGTRGGVMAVSTFFSQLMRRKGGYDFRDRQDATEWLERYVVFQKLGIREDVRR